MTFFLLFYMLSGYHHYLRDLIDCMLSFAFKVNIFNIHIHSNYIHMIEVFSSENRIRLIEIKKGRIFAVGLTYPDVHRASTSGHERRRLQNASDGLSCGDG